MARKSDGFVMSGFVPNKRDVDAIKRNAFHDQRILVVNLDDDRIAWPERQVLANVGEKLYGKKRQRP